MAEREYLSIAETAEVLGVSDDLVYELVARGDLPAVALGRRRVVPRRALDLIEERALKGFDPDRVLTTLAAAAGSSDGAGPGWAHVTEEGPTGTTGAVVPIRP